MYIYIHIYIYIYTYVYIYIYIYTYAYIYIYIYIYTHTCTYTHNRHMIGIYASTLCPAGTPDDTRKGGMIRLETLIELQILNSSFSSSFFLFEPFELIFLLKLLQTALCRAIRGNSISVNSSPPPLLEAARLPAANLPSGKPAAVQSGSQAGSWQSSYSL